MGEDEPVVLAFVGGPRKRHRLLPAHMPGGQGQIFRVAQFQQLVSARGQLALFVQKPRTLDLHAVRNVG